MNTQLKNIVILPGLIDPHVHLREPGQTKKEDFSTGTAAALAGGFTTVVDMPNNKVPIFSSTALNNKILIAKTKIKCDTGFYFGSMGDNTNEFMKVKNKVLGLKLYLNETTGNFLIDKEKLFNIFKEWKKTKKPILLHAEDDAIKLSIDICKKTNTRIHFCHISLASDLKQIIKAKKEGLSVTCGVTPHHLFLTEKDSKKLGPFGRMKPYLKTKKDQDFLWENLAFIDVIESDHAPHTKLEKNSTDPAPFGVPGLETTLPLLLTAANKNKISLKDIERLCYTNPAKIFGVKKDKKTFIEIDINKKWTIENKNLYTKCGWSPFNGWKVQGKVERVFLRGDKVFENGRVIAKQGTGKIIY